jgi:isopenicillin N synthase-like dioxygenase
MTSSAANTIKSVLEVPVVDIGALIALKDDASVVTELREDNPALADVISNIRNAASEWGFFYISNHGVSEQELERFQAAERAFFALPKDIKNTVRRAEDNARGYFDSELTKNKLDWKEVFDYAGRQEDGPADDAGYKRLRHDENQWPSDEVLPGFRVTLREYFDKVEHIARRLTQVFAVALGERSDFFDQFFHQQVAHSGNKALAISDNTSGLRLNHYPVSPEPEKTMGVYHHTDGGALTVLLQDDQVASLQVFHREAQQWTNVPPKKGTYVINIGDMVQVWSNDKFVAPMHRVLASDKASRYSAPFFYNPSYSAVIEPIVVREGETPHYRPIDWREFREKRVEGNYADLGEEVQITQYKLHP